MTISTKTQRREGSSSSFSSRRCASGSEQKMSERHHIAVLLGGPSAEREISLRSGAGVVAALRSLGHHVSEIDPRDGTFQLPAGVDVVFLALHGTYGED